MSTAMRSFERFQASRSPNNKQLEINTLSRMAELQTASLLTASLITEVEPGLRL